jgi:hypothetical protein
MLLIQIKEDMKMSSNDYNKGRRDGRTSTYNPSVKSKIFSNYTPQERDRRDDYKRGHAAGKKDKGK